MLAALTPVLILAEQVRRRTNVTGRVAVLSPRGRDVEASQALWQLSGMNDSGRVSTDIVIVAEGVLAGSDAPSFFVWLDEKPAYGRPAPSVDNF